MPPRIGGQWLTLKVETNKTEKLSPLHSHWEVEFPPLLAMSESESQVKSESESLIRNSLSSKCISQHWMLLEVPRMACCCWLMMSRIQIYRNRTSEFHLDANAFLDVDKESFKDAVDHEEGKQKQSAWLSTVNQFSHSELCNLHIVSGPVSKLIQFTIQDMWYRPTTVLFVFRTRVQLSFKQINQEAGGSVISIKSPKSVKRNACCSSFVQKLFNVCDMCMKPPIGRDMFFCWFTLSDCLLSASNRLLPLSLLSFLFLIMMLQHRRGFDNEWEDEKHLVTTTIGDNF